MSLAWIINGVMALTLLEAAGLWIYHQRTGRGLPPRQFVMGLASGLCLMLALRLALVESNPAWILGALTAAGLIHAADLWWRWPRG